MNYALNVTFQVIDDKRAKAFVNAQFAGYVRIMRHKDKLRITFRNSDNPFKNFVRLRYNRSVMGASITVEIAQRDVLESLIPIVIRNFLYNTNFLKSP